MKSIKKQFEEFRTTTPKHIQWLLLIAAFIVVLILLTLLINSRIKPAPVLPEKTAVEWTFKPITLDFSDVNVGEEKNQMLTIEVSDIVFIDKAEIDNKDWKITGNCDKKVKSSCVMNVIYKPSAETQKSTTNLTIIYHLPGDEDSKSKEIPVTFSANKVVKEEPVSESKPEPKPEEPDEPDEPEKPEEPEEPDEPEEPEEPEEPDEPEEPAEKVVQEEVKPIAPANPFTEPKDDFVLPSEQCSDFAIPGYNQSGIQIGWIKPSQGANYFHPFSDKDCSQPTGKYDWATGIITSLEDGSTLGTDAEHIGFRHIENRGLEYPDLEHTPAFQLTSSKVPLLPGNFGDSDELTWTQKPMKIFSKDNGWNAFEEETYKGSAVGAERLVSSRPYDRTFILRQFKPIPATIVSEVRADPSVYGCGAVQEGECKEGDNHSIPVRATVDRNVYSDDGRTIIIPTGTLLMGYLDGKIPGPYQSFGRMNIRWYQFVRPDGVEFNFPSGGASDPYSGDAQGRVGVPGRGSTDYVEQMVIPILTAMVPAAVNMIAPIADTFVNQINLDSNTVVQSGTMRSSEMAKQEIINTWNKITNKLVVDAIGNTVPPFSIPAGTRINVYSPVDLVVTCGKSADGNPTKKCEFEEYGSNERRTWSELKKSVSIDKGESSWIGQVRSWDLKTDYCEKDDDGNWTASKNWGSNPYGYDYRTILIYCQSLNYAAKNMLKNEAYTKQENKKYTDKYGTDGNRNEEQTKAFNQEILGLQYAEDGETILNPFAKPAAAAPEEETLTCEDGSAPDEHGCCNGETYTDMGDQGFNCCPDSGGDCFPPISVN